MRTFTRSRPCWRRSIAIHRARSGAWATQWAGAAEQVLRARQGEVYADARREPRPRGARLGGCGARGLQSRGGGGVGLDEQRALASRASSSRRSSRRRPSTASSSTTAAARSRLGLRPRGVAVGLVHPYRGAGRARRPQPCCDGSRPRRRDDRGRRGAGGLLGSPRRRPVAAEPRLGGPAEDGDPRAAWLRLDLVSGEARFSRIAYPVARTQAEIRERGCPIRSLSVWLTACSAALALAGCGGQEEQAEAEVEGLGSSARSRTSSLT